MSKRSIYIKFGRRQEADGRRQEAGGRRQEAGGKRVLLASYLLFRYGILSYSQFPIPYSPCHQTFIINYPLSIIHY
ncbi:MAG: hypothetical protein F6K41_16545 [Symploca sp. SIO3E6]|nr:hypothetical protein [Caldora sp. SIO3E6]